MEQTKKPNNAPNLMICPAFRVENGIITQVNSAAIVFGIQEGAKIDTLIHTGAEEFALFQSGRLDLTLWLDGSLVSACVIPDAEGFTFCIDSDFAVPEQRALALAAQHLREPLSNALLHLEDNAKDLPQSEKERLSHIHKNLQQMMRMLCNMSDLANYHNSANLCNRDAVAIFREVLEKAQAFLEKANKRLVYTTPNMPIFCHLDAQMLERAILNLISNAAIYLEGSDVIKADLVYKNQRLFFSVENTCNTQIDLQRDLFARYMRQPAVEDGRNGIGLGLPIVHAVASAHGGVLLMDQPKNGQFRVTMTLSAKENAPNNLRSPIRIPIDYAGGWDHTLMELSGILPAELYES